MRALGRLTILIVDDEQLFLHSLSEGLQELIPGAKILTALHGLQARSVLEQQSVDLLLTDIKMPLMDGFELLAWVSRQQPQLPVLVMTAFWTTEIEARLQALGLDGFVEKPIELKLLADRILDAVRNETSGFVQGIGLATFLQMIEMERKSCTLRVTTGDRIGELHFEAGTLVDASAEGLTGEDAASLIVLWPSPAIEILSGPRSTEQRIHAPLHYILLEAFRVHDELHAKRTSIREVEPDDIVLESVEETIELEEDPNRKELDMSAQEKLKELASLDGFQGAGVFTPTGEGLAMQANSHFTKDVGILANNVLMNAQKASLDMGTGRGQMVHIEAERAHILVRCCNEGTDPLKSQPGKAHIHVVLAVKDDSSIGLAKLKLNNIAERLAEDFRM